MSTKEIGRSIFAGRSAVINQTVIKAIASHHGETVKFIKVSKDPTCDCLVESFSAYDPGCAKCGGSGFVTIEVLYITGVFQPYSYFSGSDNQKLIYKGGTYERNRMKFYITGDEFRSYEPRNGDFVRYRNVNYYIISIMPYTGTNSELTTDGELTRELVYAECLLSTSMDDTPFTEETDNIQ